MRLRLQLFPSAERVQATERHGVHGEALARPHSGRVRDATWIDFIAVITVVQNVRPGGSRGRFYRSPPPPPPTGSLGCFL